MTSLIQFLSSVNMASELEVETSDSNTLSRLRSIEVIFNSRMYPKEISVTVLNWIELEEGPLQSLQKKTSQISTIEKVSLLIIFFSNADPKRLFIKNGWLFFLCVILLMYHMSSFSPHCFINRHTIIQLNYGNMSIQYNIRL